jgi:hypothetical protein
MYRESEGGKRHIDNDVGTPESEAGMENRAWRVWHSSLGGGHRLAAGCSLPGPPEAAAAALVAAVLAD